MQPPNTTKLCWRIEQQIAAAKKTYCNMPMTQNTWQLDGSSMAMAIRWWLDGLDGNGNSMVARWQLDGGTMATTWRPDVDFSSMATRRRPDGGHMVVRSGIKKHRSILVACFAATRLRFHGAPVVTQRREGGDFKGKSWRLFLRKVAKEVTLFLQKRSQRYASRHR